MTDNPSAPDPVERLAGYAPTRDTLAAEWDADDRADLRARLLADAASTRPARFRPRRPRRAGRGHVLAPLLAAAAVIALIVGVVAVAVGHDNGASGDGDGLRPAGPEYAPARITDTDQVGPHQYAYTATSAYKLSASGRMTVSERSQDWIAPDGDVWSYRVSDDGVQCYRFSFTGSTSFSSPTKAFVQALPTDPDALESYLRGNVGGSSSNEEAVFTAVGDLLRSGDGLATSTLRAALVTVLSRTSGITVHQDVAEPGHRRAVRVDFVDEKRRPGELASLYVDPTTYQLLGERQGSSGRRVDPGAPLGPSVNYTVPPEQQGATGAVLTGPANGTIVTAERVVDRLPAKVKGCAEQNEGG